MTQPAGPEGRSANFVEGRPKNVSLGRRVRKRRRLRLLVLHSLLLKLLAFIGPLQWDWLKFDFKERFLYFFLDECIQGQTDRVEDPLGDTGPLLVRDQGWVLLAQTSPKGAGQDWWSSVRRTLSSVP